MNLKLENFSELELETDSDKRSSDFCEWLRQEFKSGNQAIDIDNGSMSAEDAFKLLKKIKQEFDLA